MDKISIRDICALLTVLITRNKVDFLYQFDDRCKCFVIDEMVFEFREEIEGSFTVHFQSFAFLWMRETPGWDVITKALAGVTEDSKYADDDHHRAIISRLYNSACGRLRQCLND